LSRNKFVVARAFRRVGDVELRIAGGAQTFMHRLRETTAEQSAYRGRRGCG
jgi:hypothetical protein